MTHPFPTRRSSELCGCRRRGRKGCRLSSTSARPHGRRSPEGQPIEALPFKGRVGWGWVSPPHKHHQEEEQTAMEGQARKKIRNDQRQRALRRNATDTEHKLWESLRKIGRAHV